MNTILLRDARDLIEWHNLSPAEAVAEVIDGGVPATAEERAQVIRLLTEEQGTRKATS